MCVVCVHGLVLKQSCSPLWEMKAVVLHCPVPFLCRRGGVPSTLTPSEGSVSVMVASLAVQLRSNLLKSVNTCPRQHCWWVGRVRWFVLLPLPCTEVKREKMVLQSCVNRECGKGVF